MRGPHLLPCMPVHSSTVSINSVFIAGGYITLHVRRLESVVFASLTFHHGTLSVLFFFFYHGIRYLPWIMFHSVIETEEVFGSE